MAKVKKPYYKKALEGRASRLHQSGGQKVEYGPEGALLHGGLKGKSKKEREKIEKERVRRHNEEIRSGSEKGKEWQ